MHDGITQLVLPAESVWRPDIYIWNSVSEDFHSLFDVELTVNYDGRVNWLPPGLVKSSFLVDMTRFPFDTQFCELRFGSWSHTKDKINLYHKTPTNNITGAGQTGDALISSTFHYNSTEWEIGSTEGTLNEAVYPCCPSPYQDFVFKIELRRYLYTPIVVLILPCALTALLAIMTFFVPPDAGEKIGLSK